MANRFDKYVATEYVGMPVDYYQTALMAKESQAQQQFERQRLQLQAYGQITPIGADAKALQTQLFDRIKGQISEIASKKDLRTQQALTSIQGIVNDPETLMASRGFMQDVSDYTKAQKAYEDYVKENPNDVNALGYLKAQFNVGQQTGDPTKYRPGAFASIGPFTKYYDWRKRYNEIAATIKKSGAYDERVVPGNRIRGEGWEGTPEKQVHDAVMQQLSTDSDAMNQINREMDYNAFRGNPTNPEQYFNNVRMGDAQYTKSKFDQVMKVKTDFNDPSMAQQLKDEFRQRFIQAGQKVPPKKELDKLFGAYRIQTIKDANDRLTDMQNEILAIRRTDPRAYTTNKFIETAVQGIAETHSNLIKKGTLKGDAAGIAAANRAQKLWMFNERNRRLEVAMAGDNTVRVQQGNTMLRGDAVKAWNDPNVFKGTPLEGVSDAGEVSAPELVTEAQKKDYSDGFIAGNLKRGYDWVQEVMPGGDKWLKDLEKSELKKNPTYLADKTKKIVKYLEDNFGSAIGMAPTAPQNIGRAQVSVETQLKNYIARGKKFMGDMKMKNQEVAPMVYHVDALSGSGGRAAPFNKTVSETLGLSEYIYTEGGKGNEKEGLMKRSDFKVGDKENLSLKDAIAASNGVSVITDSKFGNPALRYELQTKDGGSEVIYVEQRPDQGGPISKIMESYNITGISHQGKPGGRVVAINSPTGPQNVVVETKAPMKRGEGRRMVYNMEAAGMENFVYVDPNHPALVNMADTIMKNNNMSKQAFISYVNNAYRQYENGNRDYKLDPATNMIVTPKGIKLPPMKYVRVDNQQVGGLDKYVLVAPGAVTIGGVRVGGQSQLDVGEFERIGIENAVSDPSMQYYRRFPGSRPKNVNIGSYFDLYDESLGGDDIINEEPSDNQQP